MFVGLEGGENDVEDPKKYEEDGGDVLEHRVASKFSTNGAVTEDGNEPSNENEEDGKTGTNDINGDGEC